jgi:hypothetical protein
VSDRIDHAAEAMICIKTAHREGRDPFSMMQAQVHAMLALVEQQRIANILALSRLECENESTPTDALDALYTREGGDDWGVALKLHTCPEIREGLRL